jgi:sugar O-acyltransferase (sialic acid O-acetyltransferase NeuD family)
MNDYVMFGFSHFFGDFFDLITDAGGRLVKVVLNVPEKPWPGRLSLGERLARIPYKVDVETIDLWKPENGESYLIGFSRKIMKPLAQDLKSRHGLYFGAMVHRRSTLQFGATCSEGTIVNAAAIVGPWAKLGRHVIVNRGANVGHDCQVGDYSFLAPSATLCSHVVLGENVLVGANAVILPDVKVGDGSVVGAGAVVRKDVPPGVLVAGVPAETKKVVESQC